MPRLPRLWFLERTEHDENDMTVLNGSNDSSNICSTIPNTVNLVKDGDCRRSTSQKVTLVYAASDIY